MTAAQAPVTEQGVTMVVSTEDMPGPYEVLGFVHGSCIRATPLTKDIWQAIKNLFGGELIQYGGLIETTVDVAMDRLTQHAAKLGANGVVGVRLSTSNVVVGGAEVIAYGTAVRFLDGVEPAMLTSGPDASKGATKTLARPSARVEQGATRIYRLTT